MIDTAPVVDGKRLIDIGAARVRRTLSEAILPVRSCVPLDPANPRFAGALPEPAYPSRLPRDRAPLGADGGPATRWSDPRVATAYAERDDQAERDRLWPLLAEAVRPLRPRRVSGRPDGTVLELGCGLGAFAQYLADHYWLRVYAFDVSPTMHRLGAQRFRDAWIVRTLPDARGRIPLRRAQCTACVAQRLLLHLAHPCYIVGLLSDARRVLRPGAALAIVERDTRAHTQADAYEADDGEVAQGARAAHPAEGTAYVERYRLRDGAMLSTTAWWYSPETIAECVKSAGFALEEIQALRQPARLLLYRARAL